jgi:serine/threonine-protein kinase
MGMVFVATDLVLGRRIALKTLHADVSADEKVRARLGREARAIGALTHPHIATLFDFGLAPVPFLAMELVEGESLRTLLSRDKTLSVERAVTIACQVLSALEAAHRAGIVHRDVKPANIMLARSASLVDW